MTASEMIDQAAEELGLTRSEVLEQMIRNGGLELIKKALTEVNAFFISSPRKDLNHRPFPTILVRAYSTRLSYLEGSDRGASVKSSNDGKALQGRLLRDRFSIIARLCLNKHYISKCMVK